MTNGQIANEVYQTMMAALLLAGPVLLIAAGIGLFLGILQAVTQVQDQVLPTTVKILVISAFLMIAGARFGIPLFEHTKHIYTSFPTLVR